MNTDEEDTQTKDFSRPYFQRKTGEVGLYFDADDFECEDAHAYGSEHLMRVEVNEKLGQHLAKRDLIKVTVSLEKQGHFHGIILEEFRRGNILAVIFNNMADLVELWKLHEGKQLSPLFQSVLVDDVMMKELGLCKLTLRVRVWQDELEECREEMGKMAKEDVRVDIKSRPRDVAILQRVRHFQRGPNETQLQELRDAETLFERNLSEFLLFTKQYLPLDVTGVPSLQVFQKHAEAAMKSKPSGSQHVRHFFATLELLRTSLAQAEVEVYLPLTSIPQRCETEKQRGLKQKMRATLEEARSLLDPGSSLKKLYHREWESKVLARERSRFMGLVSVIPLGLEKVTDIDEFLDEYMTGFPVSVL
ncbi:uncharacterized protein LOC143276931 [Babylonia areolata]|uniref:uncharacterized protein LOC143276931 n=1 Tax=Babylonia areolata TaxID=304850 RepID=UPI003FD0C7A0